MAFTVERESLILVEAEHLTNKELLHLFHNEIRKYEANAQMELYTEMLKRKLPPYDVLIEQNKVQNQN